MLSHLKKIQLSRSLPGALFIAASVLAIGGLTARDIARSREPLQELHAEINKPAPNFVLEKIGGGVESVVALKGKPVLLEFWTSWCAACQSEISAMDGHYQKFKDKGLVVLAVHRTRTELQQTAEDFLKPSDPAFTVLLDRTDEVYRTYVKGGRDLPAAFLIDRRGVIRKVFSGQIDAETVDKEIAKMVR